MNSEPEFKFNYMNVLLNKSITATVALKCGCWNEAGFFIEVTIIARL